MRLTKNSELLMSFLLKKKCIKNIEQSRKTNNILKVLYNDLLEADKYFFSLEQIGTTTFYEENFVKIEKKTDIVKPKYLHYDAIPENIRVSIEKKSSHIISYTFSLFKRKFKVVFIEQNYDETKKISVYKRYLEPIVMWLFILNKYSNKKCSKELTIYLYLDDTTKKLPRTKNDTLDEKNVNTAFTNTCPELSEILIYRKEEWFKVLIHETFHNFALDFSDMDVVSCHEKILKVFQLNSDVNLYEAYTETWAEIMNSLFCSFFIMKKNVTSKDDNEEEFLINTEFFLNFERKYSFFQLSKTMDYMGLDYEDLYSTSKKSTVERNNKYKEDSNVLSYYVIKTILINDYPDFLEWCVKNNGGSSLLQFKKTQKNLLNFCKYIETKYKSKSMIHNYECSKKMLELFKRINDGSSEDKEINNKLDYLVKNMRMSICELG